MKNKTGNKLMRFALELWLSGYKEARQQAFNSIVKVDKE